MKRGKVNVFQVLNFNYNLCLFSILYKTTKIGDHFLNLLSKEVILCYVKNKCACEVENYMYKEYVS